MSSIMYGKQQKDKVMLEGLSQSSVKGRKSNSSAMRLH